MDSNSSDQTSKLNLLDLLIHIFRIISVHNTNAALILPYIDAGGLCINWYIIAGIHQPRSSLHCMSIVVSYDQVTSWLTFAYLDSECTQSAGVVCIQFNLLVINGYHTSGQHNRIALYCAGIDHVHLVFNISPWYSVSTGFRIKMLLLLIISASIFIHLIIASM